MTDTPLLRLARLTLRLAGDATGSDADSLNLHAALFDLVRDLEAAPFPRADEAETRRAADLLISHFGGYSLPDAVEKAVAVRYMKREEGIIPPWEMLVPPPPARRTITREEFNAAKTDLFAELVDGARTWAAATDKERMMCHNMATHCAYAWRLTVEDA